MSQRFVCGMRKYDQHKMSSSDKPSNAALHSEQEKRLAELIRMREQPYSAPPNLTTTITSPIEPPQAQFTPWKTPSAQ